MPEFHETRRGQIFYDHQVPRIVKALERLADAVEESNRLKKIELEKDQENKGQENRTEEN